VTQRLGAVRREEDLAALGAGSHGVEEHAERRGVDGVLDLVDADDGRRRPLAQGEEDREAAERAVGHVADVEAGLGLVAAALEELDDPAACSGAGLEPDEAGRDGPEVLDHPGEVFLVLLDVFEDIADVAAVAVQDAGGADRGLGVRGRPRRPSAPMPSLRSAMDLNEIAVFIRIADKQSLTGAARALGLPKSTISRKLVSLEERLGARLVERTPRHVRLTEAGAVFYDRCAGLLAGIAAAEGEIALLASTPRGRLRVSAGVDVGVSVLGPLVKEFLQRAPQVSVELTLTDRPVDVVAEGFDLAIRIGPVRDEHLVVRKLGSGSGVLCASPSYLTHRGAPEQPEDLARHACIVFNSPPHSAAWSLTSERGPVTVRVDGPLTVNSLTLARDAAVAGLGIARLPSFVCWNELAAGRLQRVLAAWSTDERSVHAVLPSGKHMSTKVRAFLDFLVERMAHVPGIGREAGAAEAKDAPRERERKRAPSG
jgi:DNA-binding transcriptional LysR family regulator